jgi:hypothetical protein
MLALEEAFELGVLLSRGKDICSRPMSAFWVRSPLIVSGQ